MYYYIAETPANKADQNTLDAIRAHFVPEGIAGEFEFCSPGQSAVELAEKAIEHGFSTIVGIGSDGLIGQLASALYDRPVALGVIPIGASPELCHLIGYSDWKVAIQALRHRRLELCDIGVINDNIFFLTGVEVTAPEPTEFTLHMNRFVVILTASRFSASLSPYPEGPQVSGVIHFVVKKPSLKSGVLGLLNRPASNIDTLLRSEQAVVQSNKKASIIVNDAAVADTPAGITVVPQALRLIVARQVRAQNIVEDRG